MKVTVSWLSCGMMSKLKALSAQSLVSESLHSSKIINMCMEHQQCDNRIECLAALS